MKKFLCVLLAVLLTSQFLCSSIAQAKSLEEMNNEQVYISKYGNYYTENEIQSMSEKEINELQIEPLAVGAVAIFFLGVIVGYVGDGVITYKTGKAPGQWIALGLKNIENKIKRKPNGVKRIVVYNDGRVAYCYSGGCQVSW
ncbi:hypothetical protein LQU94_03080 [Peptoniphilus sp. KCTC 25270]|uniref:hypothetical protein n=1 Tax=Peptoniphilus sp. KCTC 25270 TaxID=2897414 RepID=UPI001E374D89|nr:hypothetical protein [Peptoniphilus sp. KCTC 25270]MCD1147098.1 hypothetical protein [Peptoniphilus sp. KCTC 25270]